MANPDELTREANRLYWETDTPVTALAEQLGVSRGTLYNHTHPLDAGAPCSVCGSALVFRNRSGRDRGQAYCEDCDTKQQVGAGAASGSGREVQEEVEDTAGAGGLPAAGIIPGVSGPSDPVMWLVVASVTAVVTGTLTALLIRR